MTRPYPASVAHGSLRFGPPAGRPLSCLLVVCLQALLGVAMAGTLSIAHRGDSLFAPENTIAAFTPCFTKSDMVEYDVEISSDGELVVIHGPDLDWTTDGTGSVQARTLAELKALDAGSWFAPEFVGERIPTLAETIRLLAPTTRSLIHAYSGTAEDYVRAIQQLNAKSNVILQSWDQALIARAHALDPEIKLGVVGLGPITPTVVRNLQAFGVSVLTWASNSVNPAAVQTVHSLGAELYVYTVNGPALQSFLDMGVDGIITDDPALAKRLAETPPSTRGQMASEIVSYWPFDDGLSDGRARAAHDVERRNPGSLQGPEAAATWSNGMDGAFGGALTVDGTNAFVRILHSESLDLGTNQLTLSMWVRLPRKPSELTHAYGGLLCSADDSYGLYLDRAAAELRFIVVDEAGWLARPGIPEAQLQLNTWHHLAAVYHGGAGTVSGQALIYLDGRLIDVHTGGDGSRSLRLNATVRAGQDLSIGRNAAGDRDGLACTVDDTALWRRALTPAEIRQIHDTGRGGLPLQSQMVQVSAGATVLSADRLTWSLLCSFVHGSAGKVALLASERVEGPFSWMSGASTRWLDDHHCEVSWPANASAPSHRFFRVALPSVLLWAGFQQNTLSGWTVVDQGTIEGPSRWSVEEGVLRQASNIYGPVGGIQTNRLGTFCYWNPPGALDWSDYALSAVLNSADNDGIGLMFRYRNPGNYYKLELDQQWGWKKLTKRVNGVETLLAVEAGAYASNSNLLLSVEVLGTLISARLDGAPLFGGAVADSTLHTGTVAAYSWGNAGVTFDEVAVTDLTFARRPVQRTLLSADFDSGNHAGWQVVDEGTIEGPSHWSVRDGVLRQDANIYGPVWGAQANRAGTLCCWADPAALTWTDYRVSAVLNTADDDGIGIVFRYRDPNNYYKLELDRQWSWRKLTRKVDGLETTLAQETGGYDSHTDLALHVEVRGAVISSWLGDAELFGGPVADSILGAGAVGMYSWGSAGVTFDDVVVTNLLDAGQ